MGGDRTLVVLSDIHYAGQAEQARGLTEYQVIGNPFLRLLARAFRHFIWQRDPFGHNQALQQFLATVGHPEVVVANGDYSCDSAFEGVSDSACHASVAECLGLLRQRFADFHAVLGDHELGKMSLFGARGGPRLASWERLQTSLGLRPLWHVPYGACHLIGVASTVLALPVYEPELLPDEIPAWREIRREYVAAVEDCFRQVSAGRRIILFCHDPTALPFLREIDAVRQKLAQVEATFIGHLHSPLIYWKSRLLAGMPVLKFLGNSARRMSTALNQAKYWRPFRVRLCPALVGIQLLKDGGYYQVQMDATGRLPGVYRRIRLR